MGRGGILTRKTRRKQANSVEIFCISLLGKWLGHERPCESQGGAASFPCPTSVLNKSALNTNGRRHRLQRTEKRAPNPNASSSLVT
jgi:hypothetical protein